MDQYISKSDIIAEIERRISVLKANESVISMLAGGMFVNEFKNLLPFLDTLEVKEVNLEDDVDKILEANDWNFDKIDFYQFAKYFFELGLKVQKGE